MYFNIVKNGKAKDNQSMGTVRVPSDEEIGAAYDQGREVVIALFHNTLEQLANRIQSPGRPDREE